MSEERFADWSLRGLFGELGNIAGRCETAVREAVNRKDAAKAASLLDSYEEEHKRFLAALKEKVKG